MADIVPTLLFVVLMAAYGFARYDHAYGRLVPIWLAKDSSFTGLRVMTEMVITMFVIMLLAAYMKGGGEFHSSSVFAYIWPIAGLSFSIGMLYSLAVVDSYAKLRLWLEVMGLFAVLILLWSTLY